MEFNGFEGLSNYENAFLYNFFFKNRFKSRKTPKNSIFTGIKTFSYSKKVFWKFPIQCYLIDFNVNLLYHLNLKHKCLAEYCISKEKPVETMPLYNKWKDELLLRNLNKKVK